MIYMLRNKSFMNHIIGFLTVILIGLTGCIHNDFDEPPAGGLDPDIDPALIITIEELKNLYTGGDAVELVDSQYIVGIVTADDRTGNFFKEIVLQDETAGIKIRIDISDFYNQFPEGRRVYVLLKGLYLGTYNELLQLGERDASDPEGVARISALLVDNHLFEGQFGFTVDPLVSTFNELEPLRFAYQNMLVQFEGVKFVCDEVGETFGVAVEESSTNRHLIDCNGSTVILRNSDFAEFASEIIPSGSFTVTAIYGFFGSDIQIFIRDITDISLGGGVCSTVDYNEQDFEDAEAFDPITTGGWNSVSAVGQEPWEARQNSGNTYAQVQGFGSDFDNVESWLVSPQINFDAANMFEFESNMGFWKHDGLKVFASMDFDGCNPAGATWTELSAVITNTSNNSEGVDFYGDFVPSGTIDLSSFSGLGYIGFQYIGDNIVNTTTYQIDNIVIGDIPILPGFDENFESISTSGSFSLAGWENIATVGTELWEGRSFSDNSYPQISGFGSSSDDIETYLITPQFNLAEVSTLNFDTKIAFCDHEGLKFYISTDYNGGGDPQSATWTELSGTIASEANSDCVGGFADGFINSGDIDLSSFSGMAYVAFVYRGDNDTETTTYQVDNVSIR